VKRIEGNSGLNTIKSNVKRANKGDNSIVVLDASAPNAIPLAEYDAHIKEGL
jgi:hypothetical protein